MIEEDVLETEYNRQEEEISIELIDNKGKKIKKIPEGVFAIGEELPVTLSKEEKKKLREERKKALKELEEKWDRMEIKSWVD